MADLSPKPAFNGLTLETAISVTKSILLLVGLISTVILFKVAIIPKLVSLLITTLPRLWVSFRFWLSPPYVFILFNFIIVAVAASSAFRRQKDPHPPDTNYTPISHHTTASTPYKSMHEDQDFSITARSREIWSGILHDDDQKEHGKEEEEEGKPVNWDFPTEKVDYPLPEKLCAYSGEKVQEDEDSGDSLEATWKAIMEKQGKQKPQLKKSQTWDTPPRLIRAVADSDAAAAADEDPVAWARNEVKKSEMFKQTLSFRRRISMSSEELKSRAEAFIEMVNRNIRLQRQESEQRFLQALKRTV